MAVTMLLPASAVPAGAASDRTLYLHYTHTGETARITFWRNGRFDQRGLNELNYFLRDWRRAEATEMDPNLFNLIWEVYQSVGATQPIHVVSAYRAPETNEMLRSRSSAVAKNSRHTQGMAMDFFIPGVPLSKLRAVAMQYQIGGVGYYPSSGSPFVHLDTGNVRAWPRMTRAQLQQIFPDGRTLHLPTDGVPLSESGRQYAAAQWQRCQRVPCSAGGSETAGDVRLASAPGSNRRSLLDIFRGDKAEAEAEAEGEAIAVASVEPAQRNVASQPILVAPVPPTRPTADIALAETAPVPPSKPGDILMATLTTAGGASSSSPGPAGRGVVVADLEPALADTPARGLRTTLPASDPAILGVGATDRQAGTRFAAYAPVTSTSVSAQRAVEMLLEQRQAEDGQTVDGRADLLDAAHLASASQSQSARRALDMLLDQNRPDDAIGGGALNVEAAPVITASFTPDNGLAALVRSLGARQPAVQPLPPPVEIPQPFVGVVHGTRNADLIAPDMEHVLLILGDPAPITGGSYAVMYPPDRADFNPATQLGSAIDSVHFVDAATNPVSSLRFTRPAPLLLASR
ncbi:MAG TPA: DUF882 domain-containing protein [Devosiaceae bacterium]|nr:DUF882 domain-containing protein [Devosiaceae bacterium]